MNFTQFMNSNIKTLGRRFYSPSLKDVAWLEDAQLIFLIFHTFVCKFSWVDKRLDAVRGKNIYRQMYGKLKKLVQWLIGKLHPSNLVNAIFYFLFNVLIHKLWKIQFRKKSFAIGFPYKHCNFWPLCLPVKMAWKGL